jgi:hypothetical protein
MLPDAYRSIFSSQETKLVRSSTQKSLTGVPGCIGPLQVKLYVCDAYNTVA